MITVAAPLALAVFVGLLCIYLAHSVQEGSQVDSAVSWCWKALEQQPMRAQDISSFVLTQVNNPEYSALKKLDYALRKMNGKGWVDFIIIRPGIQLQAHVIYSLTQKGRENIGQGLGIFV